MILILISIFAPMIGNTDGSNIKNVDYTLNEDKLGYTMHMDMGLFNVYGKPPDNLKIPETHKGLPITNIKFFSCEHNIETIKGSKNLITIEKNAFDCRCQGSTSLGKMKLKSVVFPIDGNLKRINSYAFYKCSNLESIVLPRNFEGFGAGVFYCCVNLKAIYIYNPIPPTGAITLFDDEVYIHGPTKSFTIYVPKESVETYKNSHWAMYSIQPIGE